MASIITNRMLEKEVQRYMSEKEKDHTEIERLNSNIDSLKALASAIKSISSNGYFSEYNEAKAKGCLRGIRKELPVLKKILKELDNVGKTDG